MQFLGTSGANVGKINSIIRAGPTMDGCRHRGRPLAARSVGGWAEDGSCSAVVKADNKAKVFVGGG